MKGTSSSIKSRHVELSELRKLASEGALSKRGRKPKYRTFLEGFVEAPVPAIEALGLTVSEMTQLIAQIPKVFGHGKVSTRTMKKSGEGKDTRYDILLVKRTPETEKVLAVKNVK